MAILLALGAAICWGATDFLGGAVRRETPVLAIVCVSELIGLVLLVPVLIVRGVRPTDPRLLLGCVAGVSVAVELGLIYLALSRGEAFITPAVGALGAAIAVTVGLIGGDPVNPMIGAGLLCALVGGSASGWTSSAQRSGRSALRSAGMCVGAAAAVATTLTCLHVAAHVDPYWATAAEHAGTAFFAGLVALASNRGALRGSLPKRSQLPGLMLLAIVGVGGDLAYAAASHHGALSIVSATASLYPLTTVALGMVIQRRRSGRIQTAGIAIALLGAALLGT